MALGDLFQNRPSRTEQLPRFSPESQGLQNASIAAALNQLGNVQQNRFDFAPIQQQAMTNFKQQTLPTIAERFTSMGGQGSSAFGQQLGAAGANLEENLAALKSQYGLQQQGLDQNLLAMLLGAGLQPSFENIYLAGEPSFAAQALPVAGQVGGRLFDYLSQAGMGAAQGGVAGGPVGAAVGALSGLFSRFMAGRNQQPQTNLSQFQAQSGFQPRVQPGFNNLSFPSQAGRV